MQKKIGISTKVNERELGVYLFVEQNSGFAPAEWSSLYGQRLGKIIVARKDFIDFKKNDFFDLYSYIYSLMDYYSDNRSNYVINNKLNIKEYMLFNKAEKLYQKKYFTFLANYKNKPSVNKSKIG